MLASCLASAFPASQVRAVAVGLRSRWSAQKLPVNLRIEEARWPYEEAVRCDAPFPICPNYEAKAWRHMVAAGAPPGSLFWNVIGG